MERPIDFSRKRYMLCDRCGLKWLVDLDWMDRWEQALETCPGCGVTCEEEISARVTVDADDPALQDRDVPRFAWYHTTTQPEWPALDFDPAAKLTSQTRLRMGGDKRVKEWAERQKSKALHVGTYEAAIHNMLRRIEDQADHGSQFYLYRVYLDPTVAVRESWLVDPSNFVGDVVLDEVCPPGIDVARYLNYHEDPGGLSLALGRSSIVYTRRLTIPLHDATTTDWVTFAATELERIDPSAVQPERRLGPIRPKARSQRSVRARELTAPLASMLPVNLRSQFYAAAQFTQTAAPSPWAEYVAGLASMVTTPESIIARLDAESPRYL